MESCIKCAIGPVGATGHADLFSYSFSGPSIGLKCRTCGRMWLRKQDGETFTWTASEASEGSLLPSR